jgi:class 3 adenylate cyclase
VPEDGLSRARRALERGDVLIAYDEACRVLASDPDDLDARYLALLALARSGAAERAASEADELLAAVEQRADASRRLAEDVAALGARIAKDRALRGAGPERVALGGDAARRYEAVADRYGGYYACINAATMWLVAGDPGHSRELARRSLELVQSATPADDDDRYWSEVTEAEAQLLLGDAAAARAALARAAEHSTANVAARAATRRQLRLICSILGIDTAVLDPLRLPGVLHFCGHITANSGLGDGADGPVRREIDEYLDRHDVGIAFGSLAAGADIVVAEAVLARDGELHVVLPFDRDEFSEISVRPSGADWWPRFTACLERATSVTLASDSRYLGDDVLFSYASRIAMGHARNRAAALGTEAEQLALWDGRPARGLGGTADDVAAWRAAGGRTHVITLAEDPRPRRASTGTARERRAVRAILFADLHGFSALHDEDYVAMISCVLRPLASVVDRYGGDVLGRNSWGDGIHLVFADPVAAGNCALDLQQLDLTIDRADGMPPSEFELRIGLHVGPVFEIVDPLRDTMTWWGREVTRAARIEPRTPEGQVYATDAFAALLALEPGTDLVSEYVGRVTTAKAFETIPMYRILRRGSGEGSGAHHAAPKPLS